MNRGGQAFLEAVERVLDPLPSYEGVLALLQEELAIESGTIHRLDPPNLLRLEASLGIPPPVLAIIQTIPVGKGMAGLAVERRLPVTTCNLQTDRTGDVRPGARATGLQGSIVVPIFSGDHVVGALGVANTSERVFGPAETELLLEVGRRLGRRLARRPAGRSERAKETEGPA